MKTLKKALTTMGIISMLSGFAGAYICIESWDFTAIPWALIPAALGIVCLDLAGAFEK